MNKPFNETGAWCIGDYGLCEHNLEDAPMIRRFVCSGIGGKCSKGTAYSAPGRWKGARGETGKGGGARRGLRGYTSIIPHTQYIYNF